MGFFILFEGGEGGGKSTQTRALQRYLIKQGVPVTLVREPGGTAVGKVARRLLKHKTEIVLNPLTELFLFAVARSQLVSEVIRPALDQGHVVICDRYTESTVAYQGYGRGLDLEIIKTINHIATTGLRPDLIFLLDLDVNQGLARKGAASKTDRFEQEDITFHQRVRDGYRQMAQADPNRWVIIDAGQPKRTISKLVREKTSEFLSAQKALS